MAFSEKSQLFLVHKKSETKSFLSILCFRHFRRKIYGFWNEENWQNILCTVIAALHLFSNPDCNPYTYLFWFSGLSVWQYGLWSFQTGVTKLARFLPKNQHTQRQLLHFENWVIGKVSKSAKISLSKSIFYFKNYSNLSQFFFSWKNINLGAHFLLLMFLITSLFKSLYFLKWCPIFDTSPLTQFSKIFLISYPPFENSTTYNAIGYQVYLRYLKALKSFHIRI